MPVNIVTARQGVLAQLAKIKENVAIDTDPITPTPYIVPMSGTVTLSHKQELIQAKIGDGRRSNKGSFRGMIDASGDIPTSLDFRYVGIDIDCHMGHDVYVRIGDLHRWNGFGTPIPFQIEKRFTQATAIYHRLKALYSTMMKWAPQASGQAQYTMSHLGAGDLVRTAIGGTDVDYGSAANGGFTANNYFNGSLRLQGVDLVDVTGFGMDIDSKITRKDGLYHGGTAAAFNFGIPLVSGDLGRIFSVDSGDTFLDLAINETVGSLECTYFDLPPEVGPTKWLRFALPAIKFSVKDSDVNIEESNEQSQHYIAQKPSGDLPAEMIGLLAFTSTQTVTVPAASHFYTKPDGGAVVDVDLSAIAGSKTIQQIVTAINLDAGFNVKAIADFWGGHFRVRSLSTVAATSKIQNQAGTGNINALIGTTDVSTIWAGRTGSEIYIDLKNGISTDY